MKATLPLVVVVVMLFLTACGRTTETVLDTTRAEQPVSSPEEVVPHIEQNVSLEEVPVAKTQVTADTAEKIDLLDTGVDTLG